MSTCSVRCDLASRNVKQTMRRLLSRRYIVCVAPVHTGTRHDVYLFIASAVASDLVTNDIWYRIRNQGKGGGPVMRSHVLRPACRQKAARGSQLDFHRRQSWTRERDNARAAVRMYATREILN